MLYEVITIAVSFGRAVITTPQLAEVVVQMPSGTFFLETDDANIPINDMYNYVAELKNMPVDTLKTDICKFRITSYNVCYTKLLRY